MASMFIMILSHHIDLSVLLFQIASLHIPVEDHTSEIIWAAQIGLVGFWQQKQKTPQNWVYSGGDWVWGK